MGLCGCTPRVGISLRLSDAVLNLNLKSKSIHHQVLLIHIGFYHTLIIIYIIFISYNVYLYQKFSHSYVLTRYLCYVLIYSHPVITYVGLLPKLYSYSSVLHDNFLCNVQVLFLIGFFMQI